MKPSATWRFSWAVLLLVLLPLLPLGRPLFSGETIGPFDQLAAMEPWRSERVAEPDKAYDVLQMDGALQFYVWRDEVIRSWRDGKVPFWNGHQLLGQPVLANSQSAPFYPLHMLFGFCGVPTGLAITLLAWFHLAVAGLGTRALARRLGADDVGAWFAGAAFALSPFMVAWTVLPSVITTVCWLPVALNLMLSCLRDDEPRFVPLGLAVGMMCLGGHLQFVFYGLIALLLAGVAWTAWAAKGRTFLVKPVVKSVLACMVGVALAAVQILPTLEFSKNSHRKTTATAEGYAAYAGSAIKPYELVGLVAPESLGVPGQKINDEAASPNQAYWPLYLKPGANFAESALYLGPTVLLGALLLRRRNDWSRLGPVVIVAAAGILMALGTVLNAALYFGIPGFASTGSPGRASLLFVLAMCVLAGVGFSNTGVEEKDRKYGFWPIAVVAAVALLSFTYRRTIASLPTWIESLPLGGGLDATTAAFLGVFGSVAVLGAALFPAKSLEFVKTKSPIFLAGLLTLTLLFTNPTQFVPSGKAPATKELGQDHPGRVAMVNGPWGFFEPAPAVYPPNTAYLHGLVEVGGYDSLIDAKTVEMIKAINGGEDPAPPANGNMMFVKRGLDVQALREAGVTEVMSIFELPQFQGSFNPPVGTYQVPDAPGLVTDPDNNKSGELREMDSQGLAVYLNRAGEHVIKFRNLPGWTATGATVIESQDGWIHVKTETPGQVRLDYEPPGFALGFKVSVLASIAFFVAAAQTVPKRLRSKGVENLAYNKEA